MGWKKEVLVDSLMELKSKYIMHTEMSSVILFINRCFNLVADQSIQILLLMIVGEVNLCEVKI